MSDASISRSLFAGAFVFTLVGACAAGLIGFLSLVVPPDWGDALGIQLKIGLGLLISLLLGLVTKLKLDLGARKESDAKVQRMSQLYAALSDCNQTIVRSTCEQELFAQICRNAVQHGGMKMAWIGLLNQVTQMIEPVASHGDEMHYLDEIQISAAANSPYGHGASGIALRSGKPVWCQDFIGEPRHAPWKARGARSGWGGVAALPLHRGGVAIGVFSLYVDEINSFDAAVRDLLSEMASDVSFALENFVREAARKQAEDKLLLAAKVFEQSNEGFTITDAHRNIVLINRAFTAITGYSEAEAVGQNPRMLSSGRQDQDFYRAMWQAIDSVGHWRGEVWNRRKDGSVYPEWLSISKVLDGDSNPSNYIGIFSDISQRKAAEEHIQRLGQFDPLTGLANRILLGDRIKQAISAAHRSHSQLAVLFFDLDHFKYVNDTLGHSVGDKLLIEIAARLKCTVRDQDTVSRLGGDEFILALPDTDAHGATRVAEKLLEAVALTHCVEQYELVVTPSIGIAMYPADGADFDALFKCADAAMYRAKQDGRNRFRFYTSEMQERSARILQLENALRGALKRAQLSLHYQPQISIESGLVVGAEALLRWQHPELGMIPPAEFIPIAEDSGQILAIGEWVLRSATRQCKEWIERGFGPMTIAVNLSAIQFRQTNLPEVISRILAEENLPAHYLELELTESVAMDNPLDAIAVMDELHARGVRMSIDDFGTGYSSLSYLKRFQVYKLKIDQSFVRDISDDPEDRAIVGAIISMAHSLGMQTIAEGVETSEQLAFLRERGCDEVQGYYFSKPLPAGQFEALLSDLSPISQM